MIKGKHKKHPNWEYEHSIRTRTVLLQNCLNCSQRCVRNHWLLWGLWWAVWQRVSFLIDNHNDSRDATNRSHRSNSSRISRSSRHHWIGLAILWSHTAVMSREATNHTHSSPNSVQESVNWDSVLIWKYVISCVTYCMLRWLTFEWRAQQQKSMPYYW